MPDEKYVFQAYPKIIYPTAPTDEGGSGGVTVHNSDEEKAVLARFKAEVPAAAKKADK